MSLQTPQHVSSTSDDPLLCLDPNSLVLAGDDSLQFIHRRGSLELHGKNLHRLHAAFAPHLDGSRRQSELIAAVPEAQAAPVRSYLRTLRQAGALVPVDSGPPVTSTSTTWSRSVASVDSLGPQHPRGLFRLGGVEIAICLGGPQPQSFAKAAASCLIFATPSQATEWLTELRRMPTHGAERQAWRSLVVTADSGTTPETAELERRAAIARWLLHSGAGPVNGLGRIQIFRLDEHRGQTQRLAVVDAKAGNGEAGRIDQDGDGVIGLATLADQLGVVCSDHVEQLPLVSATARLPWAHEKTDRPIGWRFGLSYENVRHALLDDFLGRLSASEAGFVGGVADAPAMYRPNPVDRAPRPTLHSGSRRELLVGLLEQRQIQAPRHSSRQVDFLAVSGDARVRCVQKLLRLHHCDLRGHLDITTEGATVVRWADIRVASFFPHKALLELLLAALWRSLHASDPQLAGQSASPAVPLADYATTSDLDSVLKRLATARVCVNVRQLWGRAVWSGCLIANADAQLAARGDAA